MRRIVGVPSFMMMVLLLLFLAFSLIVPPAYADSFGYQTVAATNDSANTITCTRASLSVAGTVTSISFYSGVSGNVKVGIYTDSNGPNSLVTGPVERTGSTAVAWNTVAVTQTSLTAGTYWLCGQSNTVGAKKSDSVGTMRWLTTLTYGGTWPNPGGTGWVSGSYSDSIYATYSTGPDFTITASPTSQGIGAGNTASFTLNLAASGGFTETVSLSVTSGCPSGVTCTVTPDSIDAFPGSSTLSVPTLITTSGSYSVVVHAQSTSKSHDVTVTLSVTGPASYGFNVKSGATQIVVTLTYAWTGSGTPPAGSITIVGPGGTPQYPESSGAVYDRTSIAVSGSSNTYTLLHRVTFIVSDITSPQVWTALVSLAGVSTYNITIEVG